MFNLITILLILFINCHMIYTLIDLNYCDKVLTTIDKVNKKSHEFNFDVYMEKFYYARINDSKSLACCAPRGSTIKWVFYGKPLEQTNSTFRVVPQDHRYIQTTSISNNDFYSRHETNKKFECFATNKNFQEKTLSHEFPIYYNGGSKGVLPSLNYWSGSRGYSRGKEMKLRCSFFLGYDSSLEPFVSVDWSSNSTEHFNQTYLNSRGVKKEYIYRDGGSVNYISTLNLKFDEDIWGQDFIFKCDLKINETIPENKVSHTINVRPLETPIADLKEAFTLTITSIVIVLFTIIAIGIVSFHFQIEIRLLLKDSFGKIETSDKNDKDVFVCYNFNKDSYCAHSLYVNKSLVPHLEETLGYTCYDFVRDIKVGEYIPNTMLERMQKSRRLILILCDDLLKDNLCQLVCQTAINEALKRKLPIICILPNKSEKQKVTVNQEKLSTSIQTILNVAHIVTWPGKEASPRQYKQFWNRIRLRLPPRRHFKTTEIIEI